MKPKVICHMMSALDGRLLPSRWSVSPDGSRSDWTMLYEQIHDALEGDAWIVGRVTMAEMAKGVAHPPAATGSVERPHHFATRDADCYAIALDPSARLHFKEDHINGDHVIVLLGYDVADSHLAELAQDGVSYIVADDKGFDLPAMLEQLGAELGIKRLLLEGGGGINGTFFQAGLVDEFSVLLAPALDGRSDSRTIVESGTTGLAGKVQLSFKSCKTLQHGIVHLSYTVVPASD